MQVMYPLAHSEFDRFSIKLRQCDWKEVQWLFDLTLHLRMVDVDTLSADCPWPTEDQIGDEKFLKPMAEINKCVYLRVL